MSSRVRVLGIRHHGPGSARSVVHALDEQPPSIVLVEGPPEAEAVLSLAAHDDMRPPVALLLYAPKEPQRAMWYPMAEFSPEWQAMRWATAHDVPVRFIDLPAGATLAPRHTDETTTDERPADGSEPTDEPDVDTDVGAGPDELPMHALRRDPVAQLAQAAGYDDAERWWEDVVEHRDTSPFEQIAEAMAVLREEAPPASDQAREDQREAQMRMGIRTATKDGFEDIVVVCGAWHVPALVSLPPATHDRALLKGLAKLPVKATWVPWTNGRLAFSSGYGAGVTSPGWYHHVFTSTSDELIPGWLAHTARLLRERDLDAPPAMVIDAVRLTDALAAMRGRPAPGLDEVLDATRATLCAGGDEPLALVHDALVVGDLLGSVPDETPSVPIAADLRREQRRLRLSPEALAKVIDLDLRKPIGLDRSRLLRRLVLLDVHWGALQEDGGGLGTFHEYWELAWQPESALALIDASRYGTTIGQAATARTIERGDETDRLVVLTSLIEDALDADLPDAVERLVAVLAERAAIDRDAQHLMEALPPLARVRRYGSVRAQDTDVLAPVVAGMVTHAALGLPLACASLDDDAAARLVRVLSTAASAVGTLADPTLVEVWNAALTRLADQAGLHARMAGRVVRLLLDAGVIDHDDVARRLSLALSAGTPPADGAAWLEGFLSGSGLLLVHDERLLTLIDEWLGTHDDDTFIAVVPLLRRAFGSFPVGERRAIGAAARTLIERGGSLGSSSSSDAGSSPGELDHDRAARVLPTVAALLGVPFEEEAP